MSQKIRLQTKPNDGNLYVTTQLNQNFDFLEVLSMKLSQEDVYKQQNANYGIVAGRVIVNGGVGVPNAKVSVFIPLKDGESNIVSQLYPYKSVYDKNNDGVRYNLLENKKQSSCHAVVGTMPTKREILDNEIQMEIYEKYFSLTTVTNQAGDYMICGVPIGVQTLHVDMDISDIGFLSIKPYDLIEQGYDEAQFVNTGVFDSSKDIDKLPQIQSLTSSIDVKPFWGESNYVGVTRLDFECGFTIQPNALFMGSIYTNSRRQIMNLKCRPRIKQGNNCDLTTSAGKIEIIRRISRDSNLVEYLDLNGAKVDDDGNWAFLVPMNLDNVITDEFGKLIPTEDNTKGISTKALYRFKIGLNQHFTSYKFRTANYLVPNLYNNFQFGDDTNDIDFYEFKWKGVYTIGQFISRYQKTTNDVNKNFIGIKRIGECERNNPHPFNRADFTFNTFYLVICVLLSILQFILETLNSIIIIINDILDFISFGSGFEIIFPQFTCNEQNYSLEDISSWIDCVKQGIAEDFGVVRYEFYNDWVNGGLYSFLFKYKVKYRRRRNKSLEKFCDFNCREISFTTPDDPTWKNHCHSSFIVEDGAFSTTGDYNTAIELPYGRGVIVTYKDELFYAARHDVDINMLPSGDTFTPLDKGKMLYPTNITDLGSMVRCDYFNRPFLIDQLEDTSFQEDEGNLTLYNPTDCYTVNAVNKKGFTLINQTGIDIVFSSIDTAPLTDIDGEIYTIDGTTNQNDLPDDDDQNGVIMFDRDNITLRKWLCQNFNFYGVNGTYNLTDSSGYFAHLVDSDGDILVTNIDSCSGFDDDTNPSMRVHPYYFYFGISQNKSALQKAREKYFKCV